MIPAGDLISDFQTMYREHWRYEWGAAGKGCVDCSGAFVYAYRLHGLKIAHGSNAIARGYVDGILSTNNAAPGMAAFKVKMPGDSGYALPDKYKNSGDLRDFYHVGLVDSTGQYVLNAKSTSAGFSRDPLNKWACVGRLKAVQYETEVNEPLRMMVCGPDGKTVNLRTKPNGPLITRVPSGTVLDAEETPNADWMTVNWNGKGGYMMAKFLVPVSSDPEPEPDEKQVSVTLSESVALALRDALIKELGAG